MTIRPLERDWFAVPWLPIWRRLRITPDTVPGVHTMAGKPVSQLPGDKHCEQYVRMSGSSRISPFPHRVHRSHLPVLVGDTWSLGLAALNTAASPAASAFPILRSYQQDDVQFIRSRRGTLLASEQRTGKTPIVTYSHESQHGIMIVLAPLSARLSWHEWAARRFGHCGETGCSTCARVDALPQVRRSFAHLEGRTFDPNVLGPRDQWPHVLFCHYAIIPTWSELFAVLGDVGTLALDELHAGGAQQRTNLTVEAIRRLAVISHRVVSCTGTPLLAHPAGLWPLLDLTVPGAFGRYWHFARRHCDAQPTPHGWQPGKLSHGEELKKRLSEVMIRRTWREIAPSLPPIQRTLELVPLSDEERQQVAKVAVEIRRLKGGIQTAAGNLARLRGLFSLKKAQVAAAMAIERLDAGENMLVWTWHKQAAEAVEKLLSAAGRFAVARIDGSMKLQSDRERILLELRRDGSRPRVLVATMAALGTGVNLSWASSEIMTELDWVAPTIAQAEMRPFDGVQPVSATYLVADCDIDRRLADSLLHRLGEADALGLQPGVGTVARVLGDAFGVEAGQTLDDLAEALMRAEAA